MVKKKSSNETNFKSRYYSVIVGESLFTHAYQKLE